MIDQIEIRKATVNDLPMVLKLYAIKDIDNGDILSIDEASDKFKKFQLYPNYAIYIALFNNEIIGTFELLIMDNLAHKGKSSGIVEDVVVDENYRSKGIGKKMMEFAIDICRNNNCYKLTLSSNIRREKAHIFYESLSFKRHGYSFLIDL